MLGELPQDFYIFRLLDVLLAIASSMILVPMDIRSFTAYYFK
jgi:hypothetical protein